MARGRMLNRKISLNKAVAELAAECGCEGALWFTWTIAHLDVEGRIHGDPDLLKATVCPRVSGITPAIIRKTAGKAHALGLLEVYEAEGDVYLQFPKFEDNQIGLRKKREPKSELPSPSGKLPEDFRQTSGKHPEDCRPKRREEKRREEKRREENIEPCVLELELIPRDGSFPITQSMIDEWVASFPGVDVPAQLRKAVQWCRDNPKRRKTKAGATKFLGGWLGRAQDRARPPTPPNNDPRWAPVDLDD